MSPTSARARSSSNRKPQSRRGASRAPHAEMPCSTPPWRWSGPGVCRRSRWRRWPSMPRSAGPSSTSTLPTATSSWRPRTGGKRQNCTRSSQRRWLRQALSRRCTKPCCRVRFEPRWSGGRSSAPFVPPGGWNRDIRGEQRSRDRDTVRAFATVAARQYGLERSRSTSVTAVLLGALDAVLAQWRRDPSERNAKTLEETYLAMVVGAYSVASADPRSAASEGQLPRTAAGDNR